jgi:hypothetical protein
VPRAEKQRPWRSAAVLVMLALGACGGKSNSAGSTTSSAVRQPATTGAPLSTSPPAVRRNSCRTANLTVSIAANGAAAGTRYFDLAFTNRGEGACMLDGFPGVSFLDAVDTPIGSPAQRGDPTTRAVVTLAPGATAYARLGIGDPRIGDCPAVTALQIRVFPPNQTIAAFVPSPSGLAICTRPNASATIEPVVDHRTG